MHRLAKNSWPDTLNLLSDGLKGRLKNTASEKPCRQPPIGETEPPAPSRRMSASSGRFRNSNPPIRPNSRTYNRNIPLPPSVPTQNTAALRQVSLPKRQCGKTCVQTEAPFIAPGLRNTIGRPFRRPPRYKQIKNRSFAGSAIDGTMAAILKTIIPLP